MIVVGGPTASGKTDLAVNIALAVGGEVVSADAMSIWRGFDIGSAKPAPEDMRSVPHHMIDVADPLSPYTVADYRAQATEAIEDIEARGGVPVVCGGTGLYIRSLLNPMGLGGAPADVAVRARWEAFAREHGNLTLHAELKACDPVSAARLHPNDVRRVVRALEVFTLTGRPIGGQNDTREEREDVLFLAITWEREELITRINRRVDAMMAAGLLEETRRLRSYVPDTAQAMQGLGYKQLAAHLRGELGYGEAVERIKVETRQYAKRQMTWFRAERGVIWHTPASEAPEYIVEFSVHWAQRLPEAHPR